MSLYGSGSNVKIMVHDHLLQTLYAEKQHMQHFVVDDDKAPWSGQDALAQVA